MSRVIIEAHIKLEMEDMSSDWAKHIAGKRKQEQQQREIQVRKDLSDRELLANTSERRWDELYLAVKTSADELNKEVGEQLISLLEETTPKGVMDKHAFKVRAGGGRENSIRFDPDSHTVHGAIGKSYTLRIVPGNEVVWKYGSDTVDAVKIAHDIIESVL